MAPRARLNDESYPEAHLAQTFYEQGSKAGQTTPGATKVGFTLRSANGDVVDAMSFLINPQGLDRADGSRSTLTATKAAFLVDNFGPAPGTIQMRQLVAMGKDLGLASGITYTAREDVQRFLKQIYLPSMAPTGPPRHVYFHDFHFEPGFEQQVFFPSNSLTISRSVDLHNVWRLDLQMISLERYPYNDVTPQQVSPRQSGRSYTVVKSDTLTKIVTMLAGKFAGGLRRANIQARLIALNPQLKRARLKPGDPKGTKNAKPMRVYPGERLVLPG